MKKDLEKIKYKKIGDYYFADNTDWCYDESGNKLALNEIDYSFIREFVDIEDKNEQVKEVLPNTDWNELEKIRNSCVNEFKKEYNTKKLSTHIYGINNLCIVCTSYKEVTVYNYYKVDENGKMIKMEPRN